MLGFLLLVVIVFLINKYLTSKAAIAQQSNPYNQNTTMSAIPELTTAEDFKTAISASNLVVVDFFATWCGPCKMLAPMLENFAKEYTSAKFYKVDVDKLAAVAASNNVSAMPTILFFKDGKLLETVIGANPPAIKQTLAKLA